MIEALNELDLVCARHAVAPAGRRSRTTRSRSASASRCRSRAARSTSTQLRNAGDAGRPALVDGSRRRSTRRSPRPSDVPRRDGDARRRWPRCAASGRRRRCSARSARAWTPTRSRSCPAIGERPPRRRSYDHFVDAPVAVGLLARRDRRPARAAAGRARRSRTRPGCGARRRRRWPRSRPQRSRSIAARLVRRPTPPPTVDATAAGAGTRDRRRRRAADRASAHARARASSRAPARAGGRAARRLHRRAAGRQAPRAGAPATPGAVARAGQTRRAQAAQRARATSAPTASARGSACAARRRASSLLGHGGDVLADRVVGRHDERRRSTIAAGTERIVAIGLGARRRGAARATPGLAGWHAGHAAALRRLVDGASAPGCVVRVVGERARAAPRAARRRLGRRRRAGRAAEHRDDPLRRARRDRRDRARRPGGVRRHRRRPPAAARPRRRRRARTDAAGARARRRCCSRRRTAACSPTTSCPTATRPVVVTIASEDGWSLAGVLASAQLDAAGASRWSRARPRRGAAAARTPASTRPLGRRLARTGAQRRLGLAQRAARRRGPARAARAARTERAADAAHRRRTTLMPHDAATSSCTRTCCRR